VSARNRRGHAPLAWLAGVALATLLAPACARADVAPGDSLLHAYVRTLSDTTDAWFGVSVAPLDTAGLDSALGAGLAKPRKRHGWDGDERRRGVRFGWSPALGFNRADGGQLGAGLSARTPLPGELSGRAQWTTGTHDVLGEGAYAASRRLVALHARASLRVAAGRATEPFDRDHYDPWFSTLGALLYGDDRHQYLRRDGWKASVRASGRKALAGVGWRDQLESPLPFTTKWTLFGGDPSLPFVTPATFGRVRELLFEGDATLPGTRFRVNASHWTSDPRLGSDFRYRRTRLTLGGDASLGHHLALVPQATYGRLRGEAPVQEAFFLGGGSSLRTLDRNALTGTGQAFARADLVLVDELGRLLHVPLPAWLPLQAGAFAASGASWGHDGPGAVPLPSRRHWPRRSAWLSEAGVGLSWRPGLPDPLAVLQVEYAIPIGADGRNTRVSVAFHRVVNLLPAR